MANGQVTSLLTCQRMRIPHTAFLRKSSIPRIKVVYPTLHDLLTTVQLTHPPTQKKELLVEGLVDLTGAVPESSPVPSLKPLVHYATQVTIMFLDYFYFFFTVVIDMHA